jgi:hypothetical protein
LKCLSLIIILIKVSQSIEQRDEIIIFIENNFANKKNFYSQKIFTKYFKMCTEEFSVNFIVENKIVSLAIMVLEGNNDINKILIIDSFKMIYFFIEEKFSILKLNPIRKNSKDNELVKKIDEFINWYNLNKNKQNLLLELKSKQEVLELEEKKILEKLYLKRENKKKSGGGGGGGGGANFTTNTNSNPKNSSKHIELFKNPITNKSRFSIKEKKDNINLLDNISTIKTINNNINTTNKINSNITKKSTKLPSIADHQNLLNHLSPEVKSQARSKIISPLKIDESLIYSELNDQITSPVRSTILNDSIINNLNISQNSNLKSVKKIEQKINRPNNAISNTIKNVLPSVKSKVQNPVNTITVSTSNPQQEKFIENLLKKNTYAKNNFPK